MGKSDFNKFQQTALDNPIDVDLIISAGAGSGKTRTLSQKVMQLIADGLPPSRLLVLTFTNNSAYDMKMKILSKFKDNKDIALQLASSHIQTFDSFNIFLVNKYSGELKISDNLNIANSDIIAAKKEEYIDEVFEEYYLKNDKKNALLETLIKFNIRDDETTKRVVSDLVSELDKLSQKEMDKVLNHYAENYLSKAFFNSVINQLVDRAKDIIKDAIYYSYFTEKNFDLFKEESLDYIGQLFKKKDNFNIDIEHLNFEDEECAQPLYEKLIALLYLNGGDFIEKVKSFVNDNEELINNLPSKATSKQGAATANMKSCIVAKNCSLQFIKNIGNLEDEYAKILSFKDDIDLLLGMAKEVIERLSDYKRITNSYLFSDIAKMALTLLTEPQYEHVAEEVRNLFDFIMVDEYQDTSDIQEALLNSLLAINKKGKRSHLFCVGDVKQCIYAFRDSNVQLFRNRQNLYERTEGAKSIAMNLNYRSGKRLLHDINHIFDYYMTMNHGSIAYSEEKETLTYDEERNIYSEPYDNFGVFRITSISTLKNDDAPYASKVWEARAIAADIQKKLKEGYLVSERDGLNNRLRKCTPSDFCILLRKRANTKVYQEVFKEFGIPLNCSFKNDLNEINAIVVLESLTALVDHFNQEKEIDALCAHNFASVARSYLYEYTDQQLFDVIYNPNRDYSVIKDDPIIVKVIDFVNRHKETSLSATLLDLVEEFGIINKLYKIGAVEDTISKIESLYQMALTQEKNGEGVSDFVLLMDSISKYDLALQSESLFKINDAVDLMTIHGSKGLERKVVYMPCETNSLGRKDSRSLPDYSFSKELGLILPYYNFEYKYPVFDAGFENFYTGSVLSILDKQLSKKEKEEEDEHVRLFYVALTRAENTVYIVGDLKNLKETTLDSERRKNSLYGMLSYAPNYIKMDDDLLKEKYKSGVIKEEDYNRYYKFVEFMKGIKLDISHKDLNPIDYERYALLWKNKYLSFIYKEIVKSVEMIEKSLFKDYFAKFLTINDDELASLFGLYFYKDNTITSKSDLLQKHREEQKVFSGDDDENEDSFTEVIVINDSNIDEMLASFKSSIATGTNLSFLGIKETKTLSNNMFKKKLYQNVPIGLTPYLLETFAKHFDDVKRLKEISFATNDYEDRTYCFDYHLHAGKKKDDVPPQIEEINVSDEIIEFPTLIKARASKMVDDEDLPAKVFLDYGTRLHRLLELVDLKTKDTSFINNPEERKIIDKVLELHIFDHLEQADIYQEYGYYDEEYATNGFIDLLIKKGDVFFIIDYKAKHIYDEEYVKQLHTYRRNIMRIFGVDESRVRMYLLSILDARIIKVE